MAASPSDTALDPHSYRFGVAAPQPVREPGATRARARATSWAARHPWLIVGGLAAIALALRVLVVRGLWVDDAISVHQAHMSLPDMLDDLRETDRHPPLHYLLLWLTTRIFGFGELSVRLPSIIAGVALVPALFLTGREMFDRRTGLVAAGLGAIAPLAVWYAQEARMYSLVMVLATFAVWAQVRVLRDGGRRYWVAYAGFTIALLYTHYFALVPILIQQGVFAVAAWKRVHRGLPVDGLMRGLWLTWLALVVAAAPLAPFAHAQFVHDQAVGFAGGVPGAGSPNGQEGSSISLYAILSNFVWAIWGYHENSTILRIAALWPLLMLVSLAVLGRGSHASARVVFALAVGPVVALLLVGLVKRDLFEVRYFAAAIPMMLLLLAYGIAGAMRRRLPAVLATAALVASMGVALADQQLNPHNPRAFDFRGAMATIEQRAEPGDTILYAPDYLRDVIAYYAPEVNAQPLGGPGETAVPDTGKVFVLGSFLNDADVESELSEAQAALGQKRALLSEDRRQQIRIWEFSGGPA